MLQCGWLTESFLAKPFEQFGDTWVAPYLNLHLEVFPPDAPLGFWVPGVLRVEKTFEDYVVNTIHPAFELVQKP